MQNYETIIHREQIDDNDRLIITPPLTGQECSTLLESTPLQDHHIYDVDHNKLGEATGITLTAATHVARLAVKHEVAYLVTVSRAPSTVTTTSSFAG